MIDLAALLPVLMLLALGVGLLSGYPVAFVLGGVGVGFAAWAVVLDVIEPVALFTIVPRIWAGLCDNSLLVALPMFLLLGYLLEASGTAELSLRSLRQMLRRLPGGLPLAVMALGVVLAASTGIVGASVTLLTVLALPTLLDEGYRPEFAAGTVAAAGTLGILIPPSVMLILLADLTSTSVASMFAAALGPGVLLAGMYLGVIVLLSTLAPRLLRTAPAKEVSHDDAMSVRELSQAMLPPVILIVLTLGSVIAGWATPTEGAALGVAGALALAWTRGTLDRAMVRASVHKTGQTTSMLFGIFLGATTFSYVFRLLGGDALVLEAIARTGLEGWGVLVLLLATVFLMGFVLDWVEIILLVIPVYAPVIAQLDVGAGVSGAELQLWFSILVAVMLQTSFLTPPLGLSLFYVESAAAGTVKLSDLYRGIAPFVILQAVAVLLTALFPAIALWLPSLLE